MNKRILLLLLTTALLLLGCAKVVLPSGGPRDIEPPKSVRVDPPSGSVNFHESQIKITFDEFFTLNNPTENVLISPPLTTSPKYLTNGKTLVIKFEDTLQPNTTYNLVFSDCIKDYHEGNALSFYHYSFSTGPAIDSFSIRGTVADANTLEGCKDFLVMLYRQDVDSLPIFAHPDYVTKSQANGNFSFNNIAPGQYKLFALKDINGNMLYDLPNEQIAFADHPVTATHSAENDSSATPIEDIRILSFEKKADFPQLTRVENPTPGIYIFPYKSSFTDFSAQNIGQPISYFETINNSKDSVFWYMKETVSDTFTFVVHADQQSDTIQLTPYKAKPANRSSQSEALSKLVVTPLNQGHRFKPLTLLFSYPIQPADSIPITCITQQDTSTLWVSIPDTFVRKIELPLSMSDKQSYSILIPDSVFWGYNHKTNDSIKLHFESHSVKDYGNLTMEYLCPEVSYAYIAQLWKDKTLIQEDIVINQTKILYAGLEPGNYRVKVIQDINHNGRWDSGNYQLKEQAEKVFFFPNTITIRAYWDSEEQFVIEER